MVWWHRQEDAAGVGSCGLSLLGPGSAGLRQPVSTPRGGTSECLHYSPSVFSWRQGVQGEELKLTLILISGMPACVISAFSTE